MYRDWRKEECVVVVVVVVIIIVVVVVVVVIEHSFNTCILKVREGMEGGKNGVRG